MVTYLPANNITSANTSVGGGGFLKNNRRGDQDFLAKLGVVFMQGSQ